MLRVVVNWQDEAEVVVVRGGSLKKMKLHLHCVLSRMKEDACYDEGRCMLWWDMNDSWINFIRRFNLIDLPNSKTQPVIPLSLGFHTNHKMSHHFVPIVFHVMKNNPGTFLFSRPVLGRLLCRLSEQIFPYINYVIC